MATVNLALVDDQVLFRQGLVSLISDIREYQLIIEADSAGMLLENLEKTHVLPDVLLMDMKLPDLSGAALNDILRDKYPEIKVIVVSMYNQERLVAKMIDGGACGYLVKNCDKAELINAINSTIETGFYFNHETLKAIHNTRANKKQALKNINNIAIDLTLREVEVLKLICKEYTNAEIAEKLFLSARTIDGHRNNLLMKTGCRNTAGLVIFAIRNGLFEIEP